MNPLTYADVRREREEFLTQNPGMQIDTPSFAKLLDELEGQPRREKAYTENLVKRFDYGINQLLEATNVPQILGSTFELGGRALGADKGVQDVLRTVGEYTPRVGLEGLMTLVAPAATIPRVAAYGARALGYGSAAARGYTESDSVLGGVVAPAQIALANRYIPQVGNRALRATQDWLNRRMPGLELPDVTSPLSTQAALASTGANTAAALAQRANVLPTVAKEVTELGAGTVLNEATRQGMLTAEGVPLMDEARNPFTTENVVANVAGVIPFSPLYVQSFRNRPKVNLSSLRQLDDWLHQRDAWLATQTVEQHPQGMKPLVDQQMQGDRDRTLVLRQAFDALDRHTSEGQVEYAEAAREHVKRLLRLSGDVSFGELQQRVDDFQVKADMAAPNSPEAWGVFMSEYNAIADDIFGKREGGRERLVDQLQKEGYLPRLTPEWLEKEFNWSLDRSIGDPKFAARAVAQKAANYMRQNLESAAALRNAERKVVVDPTDTQVSQAEREYAAEDQYIDALTRLPKNIRDGLMERHVDIQDALDKEGTTSGYVGGRGHSYYNGWRDIVTQAAQTYDPQTGLFTYRKPRTVEDTKTGKRTQVRDAEGKPVFDTETRRITELFEREPGGKKFVFYPRPKPLPTWQGGKGGVEMSLNKPGEQTGKELGESIGGEGDEIAFWSQVVTGTEGPAVQGRGGAVRGWIDPNVPVEGPAGESFMTGLPEAEQSRLSTVAEQVTTRLADMKNADVWNAVRSLYEEITPSGMVRANSMNSFRSRTMKLAIQALGEEMGARQGGKEAQDRPLGRAGQEMLNLLKVRGTVKEGAPGTPRKQLMDGLSTYFRRGNTGTMMDQVKEVMYRIAGPENLEGLGQPKMEPRPGYEGTVADETYTMKFRRPVGAEIGKDVYTTLRTSIHRYLGDQGYSGTSRELLTEVAASLAAKMRNIDADFYRLTGRDASSGAQFYAEGRPAIGVDVTVGTGRIPQLELASIVRTALHEVTHYHQLVAGGMVPRPDAYTDQTARMYKGFFQLASRLSVDERKAIMFTLRDALMPDVPEIRRSLGSGPEGYGPKDADEFTAQIMSVVEQSLILGQNRGKKAVEDVFQFMPSEIEQFMRLQYRTLGDVLDAVRQDLSYKREGQPYGELVRSRTLAAKMESLVITARALSEFRDMDLARAAGRELVANLEPGALGKTEGTAGTWVMTRKPKMPENVDISDAEFDVRHDRAKQVIADLAKEIRFRDRTEKGAKPTWWQRFYPFFNLMHTMERQGVGIAGDVWNLAAGVTPAIHRIESMILSPFLTRNAQGKFEFDGNNALIRKIQTDSRGKWRQGLNIVRRFQNENQFEPVYMQMENGVIIVNEQLKGAKELHEGLAKKFSPEDLQVIMNGSVGMDKTYQLAAQTLVKTLNQSVVNRVAGSLMAANRQMTSQQAKQLGAEVVGAFMTGDPAPLSGKLPPQQIESLARLLGGDDGLLTQFNRAQKELLSRKGFSSEQLPYDWMIRYKNEDGETKYLSAETEAGARKLAENLIKDGMQIDGEIFNRRDVGKYTEFDAPDEILHKFIDLEQRAWEKYLTYVEETQGSEAAAAAREAYSPGEMSEKELMRKGVDKFLRTNEGMIDRKRYDYLEGMAQYANRFSASIAFRSIRQELNLLMNDPRARAHPTFREQVAGHFDFVFSPTSQTISELKSITSAYYLGANLSSALIESTQSLVTLVPTLMKLGNGSIGTAYRQLWDGIADMSKVSKADWLRRGSELRAASREGRLSADDERLVMYQRAVEDGIIDHGAIQDMDYGRDQRLLLTSKFGRGDLTEVSKGAQAWDKMYVVSQHMLKLYSWSALANNKISFLAGVRHGQELGLKGDALYAHARKIKDLSTFGGGKANMPTYVSQWSSPYTRNAFVLMHTMQQYGMGMFSTYAQTMKESFGSTLPPLERVKARKALGTMLATQTALAGVFGLPFAAAMLTIIEKTFGIEANRAVREGIAALAGQDEEGNPSEAGIILADTVLNGAGNQLFGIDLSSRVGVSNLFGTSAYRGFNMADMLGPVPGILENMYTALSNFGQGEPMKAARALVPQAFKNTMELGDTKATYGDTGFRDTAGNLMYTPTAAQVGAYMFGFRPKELSQKRQAQRMMQLSEDNALKSRRRQVNDAAAGLIRGDVSTFDRLVAEMQEQNPMADPKDIMRSVLGQVADAQMEKDITTSGVSTNAEERVRIARLMGKDVIPQRSEFERTMLMYETAIQMGRPDLVDSRAISRSVVLDVLMGERKMARSQAVQLVEFLGL